MERTVVALAAGAALTFILAQHAPAQGDPKPPARQAPSFHSRPGGRPMGMRQRWRELSPEQRQRVQMNAARWMQLPAEERRELRYRQMLRQQRLHREADAALKRSGLQLEAEKRAAYEKRYSEERKRIDRELRRELEEKRQRELAPVVEKLKKEFTAETPGASATAAGSPKK